MQVRSEWQPTHEGPHELADDDDGDWACTPLLAPPAGRLPSGDLDYESIGGLFSGSEDAFGDDSSGGTLLSDVPGDAVDQSLLTRLADCGGSFPRARPPALHPAKALMPALDTARPHHPGPGATRPATRSALLAHHGGACCCSVPCTPHRRSTSVSPLGFFGGEKARLALQPCILGSLTACALLGPAAGEITSPFAAFAAPEHVARPRQRQLLAALAPKAPKRAAAPGWKAGHDKRRRTGGGRQANIAEASDAAARREIAAVQCRQR